jgi:uncharacterized HAD superfamily protein
MRIGVDLDGVLYEWEKTARYMLREVLPNSPYPKDGPLGQTSADWNYIENNVDPEHWGWLWTEGVGLGLFRHGHMFPGTIKYMRMLADLGEVIIITHRPKAAVPDTLAWLGYQQLPLSGIHILTNEEPKSGVKVDYFIDDKVENCLDVYQNTGATVFLMNRPWNQFRGSWNNTVDNLKEFYLEILGGGL